MCSTGNFDKKTGATLLDFLFCLVIQTCEGCFKNFTTDDYDERDGYIFDADKQQKMRSLFSTEPFNYSDVTA